MSKKITEDQKLEILNLFKEGVIIKEIALKYQFTVPTITRQLKKLVGIEEFKNIKSRAFDKFDVKNQPHNGKEEISFKENPQSTYNDQQYNFFEIPPIEEGFNLEHQIEVSSEPLSNFELPKLVYMVVSNKIELQVKFLKDYPEWQFLPDTDLERKSIEIFDDLKSAKKSCGKEQKVIKVPNTSVLKIVAPILVNRGISRIISKDKLLSL